jgi:hypothetical protein
MKPWWLSIEDEVDVFRLKSEEALDRPNRSEGGRMQAERHTRFSGQLISAFGPSPRPISYAT